MICEATLPCEGGKILITVKKLNARDHYEDVISMDQLSGNDVCHWLDTDMVYGLICGMELIGYLTLGYADDCGEEIESHPQHHSDARILSNVYIKEEYRGEGFGRYLIQQALEELSEVTFLDLLDNQLQGFYKRLNFEPIDDYTMVRLKEV